MFWRKKVRFAAGISMVYADPVAAAGWWAKVFGAKPTTLPITDLPQPSDLALSLQYDDAEIYLSKLAEIRASGSDWRGDEHPVVTCNDIELAHKHCQELGASPTSVYAERGPKYFEIIDPEGNVIEICEDV
jgi:Glyoxalase-like domain